MTAVILGEALVDMYCVAGERAQALDYDGTFVRTVGGAPTNFSVGLARLGVPTRLLTRVGDDAMGRFLLARLAAEGVDVRAGRGGGKTGISFVSVRDGERSFDFYGAPSADLVIGESDVDVPSGMTLFHFGSNTLISEAGLRATQRGIDAARAAGARVSCDLNVRRYRWDDDALMRERLRWAVQHCDWVKVAAEELHFVAESPDALLAMGPSLVAYTAGPDGSSLLTAAERVDTPTQARALVDTTGAGDAFWSGCVSALLQGRSLSDANVLGARNAAAVIGAIGPTTGLLRSAAVS